jgi:hypothetical protein
MVSWIGVDSRSPASIYVLSDSRISWPNGSSFDYARKVFACTQYPDIFGYCGDVLFPSIVLNQIVDVIDSGMLFKPDWEPEKKFEAFYDKVVSTFASYPSQAQEITASTLEIIHASRDTNKQFFCKKITWTKATGDWSIQSQSLTAHSEKLFVIGSGRDEFIDRYLHYNNGNDKVSRSVFHCFCNTLRNTTDKTYGGAPQLVGLYRIRSGMPFGLIYNNKRYLYGLEADDLADFDKVEWRNELFEICDGKTMTIKAGAQRQPNPLAR